MTRELSNTQKKDYAKNLFLHENLTQAEIAERTGITRKTVSRWMEAENWKGLKVSITITKEEQIRNLYRQLESLNEAIVTREKDKRYASTAEADTITKLAGAIQKMEGEVGIAEITSVGKLFINWVKKVSLEKAKEITTLFDGFVKDNLR